MREGSSIWVSGGRHPEGAGGSSEFQNHICQDAPEIVKVLYFLFMS